MPKRFLTYSRTEPARTILHSVALLSGALQILGILVAGIPLTPVEALIVYADSIIIVGVCIWAVWAATKNNIKQMSRSSFWLFILWLFTGTLRLTVVEGVGQLLWGPFMIVAVVMATVYLYLSNQRRMSDLD